jgi:hypothetical protein
MAGAKRQREFRIIAEISKLKPPDRNPVGAAHYIVFYIHNRVL